MDRLPRPTRPLPVTFRNNIPKIKKELLGDIPARRRAQLLGSLLAYAEGLTVPHRQSALSDYIRGELTPHRDELEPFLAPDPALPVPPAPAPALPVPPPPPAPPAKRRRVGDDGPTHRTLLAEWRQACSDSERAKEAAGIELQDWLRLLYGPGKTVFWIFGTDVLTCVDVSFYKPDHHYLDRLVQFSGHDTVVLVSAERQGVPLDLLVCAAELCRWPSAISWLRARPDYLPSILKHCA